MADPTKKPTGKVSDGPTKPARDGLTSSYVSKFKVPANHTKSDNAARAQHIDVWWIIDKTGSNLVSKRNSRSTSVTQSTLNLDNVTIGSTTYRRESWYPYTKVKLNSVSIQVRETNKKGEGPWDKKQSATFKEPKAPTISVPTLDDSNGRVSFTVSSEAGSGSHERVFTRYRIAVYESSTGTTTYYNTAHSGTGSRVDGGYLKNSATEFSDYYDVPNWQAIGVNDYITVTLEAWNCGWAGDSSHKSSSMTLSFPAKATIGNVVCSGTENDDKVTIYATAGTEQERKTHPVTLCRLEALVDSEYKDASEIPGTETWEQIGATDNGNLRAFAAKVGQLRPQQGNRTWLRVITINNYEEPYSTVSAYKAITDLEVAPPSTESDVVFIDAVVPREDGKSADVTVMWTETTANTGTELTWSTDSDAWESNQPPSPFEFTWSNIAASGDWTGGALIHLLGLTEGETTYIRARRYHESSDGDRQYTDYSNVGSVTPVTSPSGVTLALPRFVPRGSDIEAVWTYDSEATQTEWQLFEMLGQAPDISSDRVLDGGSDSRGSCVISSERLSSDTAYVYVSMSTGGRAIQSDVSEIAVVDPPECSVDGGTVDEKPLVMTVGSNVEASSAVVIVTAEGTGGDGFGPEQMEGDTVWSAVVLSPEWTATNDGYETEIEVPADESLFYDQASYLATVRVVDSGTGLSSDEAEAVFTVDWSHKAPQLVDENGYLADIAIVPSDTTDLDGIRTRQCTVQLDAPTGSDGTEVYDVYRVGRDGAQLIAEGVGLDATVTDPYAPFGGTELAYRVVCRTTDGNRSWADFSYEFGTQEPTDNVVMRIDFGGEYVECDRGVAPSDRWSKDFSLSSGIDGSKVGTWGSGVDRESSSQATFVRVYEESQQLAMERLAVYTGPCFVRVSDGSAYEANVEVAGRSRSVNSAGVVYSLSITQVDLTREYMAEGQI